MIEHLEVEEFHGFQTNGNSRPARLTCRREDGARMDVFGKFAGGVRNHNFGLCAELLCSMFAKSIGLPTPAPYLFNLSREFAASVPAEARDLLTRSIGTNFASEALPPGYSTMPPEARIPHALRERAGEVFAFDILIQNFDRKCDNPNLLWNRSNIFLIDHESALHPLLTRTHQTTVADLELDRFYDHIFYPALSPSACSLGRLESAIGALTSQTLDGWFDAIPEVWRNAVPLPKLREYFEWLIEHHKPVCKLIQERIA